MERQCAARSLDGIDLAALRVRAAGRGGERDVRGAGENSAGREVAELRVSPRPLYSVFLIVIERFSSSFHVARSLAALAAAPPVCDGPALLRAPAGQPRSRASGAVRAPRGEALGWGGTRPEGAQRAAG